MPIWVSDDGHEMVCVGSIEELKQLSGVNVEDLHRELFVTFIPLNSHASEQPLSLSL